MNVLDVTKEVCINFGFGKMFHSGNMIFIGSQCCIFITETTLNFKTAKLLKLCVNNSWYYIVHAEPVYYR